MSNWNSDPDKMHDLVSISVGFIAGVIFTYTIFIIFDAMSPDTQDTTKMEAAESESEAPELTWAQKQAKKDFEKNLDELVLTDSQRAKKTFETAFAAFKKAYSDPKAKLLTLQETLRNFTRSIWEHKSKNGYEYGDSEEQILVRNLVKAHEGLPEEIAQNIKKAIKETENEIAAKKAAAEKAAKELEAQKIELAKAAEARKKKQAKDKKAFAALEKVWDNSKSSVTQILTALKIFNKRNAWNDDRLEWLDKKSKNKLLDQDIASYLNALPALKEYRSEDTSDDWGDGTYEDVEAGEQWGEVTEANEASDDDAGGDDWGDDPGDDDSGEDEW